jgi:hypothetical protein
MVIHVWQDLQKTQSSVESIFSGILASNQTALSHLSLQFFQIECLWYMDHIPFEGRHCPSEVTRSNQQTTVRNLTSYILGIDNLYTLTFQL